MSNQKPLLDRSRKIISVVAILAIAIAASGIYAYYSSLPPHIGPRVSLVSPPLEFSLQLEKTTFARGENISVSISLRNISNQTVTATWGSYDTRDPEDIDGYMISTIFPEFGGVRGATVLDFFVSCENGTSVYEFIGRRNTATISRTFAAGETVTQAFIWNQLIVCRTAEGLSLEPIPSGTYYIRASTLTMGVAGWWSFQTLETSSVAIEIFQG